MQEVPRPPQLVQGGRIKIVGMAPSFSLSPLEPIVLVIMVGLGSKQSLLKCSEHKNEKVLATHLWRVFRTCFSHFWNSFWSLGNLNILTLSLYDFPQPYATQLLGMLWFSGVYRRYFDQSCRLLYRIKSFPLKYNRKKDNCLLFVLKHVFVLISKANAK